MTQLSSAISRILFAAASVLAGVAVCEKLANLAGQTLVFVGGYTPSRLLEFTTVALLFVIALQLREIKRLTGGAGSAH